MSDEWTVRGPWERSLHGFFYAEVEDEDDMIVAKVYGETVEDAQLKARLVAAAPKMLAALKRWQESVWQGSVVVNYEEIGALVREAEGGDAT